MNVLDKLEQYILIIFFERASRRVEKYIYTATHGAKRLVYLEEYEDIDEARRRERQIKDWSRENKQRLIDGNWGKRQ